MGKLKASVFLQEDLLNRKLIYEIAAQPSNHLPLCLGTNYHLD